MKIGRSIRYIREVKKMTISELSKLASVSIPMISLIEKEKKEPSLAALSRISNALNVPLDSFILLSTVNHKTQLSTSDGKTDRIVSALKALDDAESKLLEYLEETSNDSSEPVDYKNIG